MAEDIESILGIEPRQGDDPNLSGMGDRNSPYYGCGGWLAFFCVVQIIVSPILMLVACAITLSVIYGNSYVASFYLAEILGNIGLTVFGVLVGLALWRLEPGSPGKAKAFLVAALAWAVLRVFLAYALLDGHYQEAGLIETFKGLLGTVVAFAIWFSYFNVSRRIKDTFGDPRQLIHIVPPGE